METWVDSQVVFSGKIFTIRSGTVRLEDGRLTRRDVVEHDGGVAVVPILEDEFILIRQFRISIGREILEIPAGRLEAGESPESCALRELEEELGYRAGKLTPLHAYYSSVGFTTEKMYVYLGTELSQTGRKPEWDEHIEIVRLPIVEAEQKLQRGEIEDSKTLIGLYAALSRLKTG